MSLKGGAFEEAAKADKSLLILDSTAEGIVDTFLMYQRTTAVDVPQVAPPFPCNVS